MNNKVTIFANFYIDNNERFLRLQDSFDSMRRINYSRYVVNVRGSYANKVISYLSSKLSEELFIFSIESTAGWFYDSSKIMNLINTSYVLLWIEDHICMSPEGVNFVLNDLEKCNADILTYSFWNNGEFLNRYASVDQTDLGSISWFDHTVEINKSVQVNKFGLKSYLISYASIIKTHLFKKIVLDNGGEQRWPKTTPFDFEKAPTDERWLPLRRANPKIELFASIDDNHSANFSGSLQSRGLYPLREERISYARSQSSRYNKVIILIYLKIKNIFIFFSNLIETPYGYKIDYLMSFLFPWLQINNPLPEINYGAINFLKSKLNDIRNIFVYGSGQSPLFWLSKSKNLNFVEHDPAYFHCLKKDLPAHDIDYRLIEPEIYDLCELYDPSSLDSCHSKDFKGYSFEKYVDSISEFEDEYFDLVIVDGRSRPSCIMRGISKIKPGGLLLLNNSDREYYLRDLKDILISWEAVDFSSTVRGLLHHEKSTVFFKPPY